MENNRGVNTDEQTFDAEKVKGYGDKGFKANFICTGMVFSRLAVDFTSTN